MTKAALKKLRKKFSKIADAQNLTSGLERTRLMAPADHVPAIAALEDTQVKKRSKLYSKISADGFTSAALNTMSDHDAREFALMQRDWLQNTALSPDEQAIWHDIERKGRKIHADCKDNNDWKTAASWLEYVIDFKKIAGEKIAEKMQLSSPYEALLSVYSPGFSEKLVSNYIDELQPKLFQIAHRIPDTLPAPASSSFIGFTPAQQIALCKRTVKDIGFDADRAVLVNAPQSSESWLVAQKSALHEAGHDLYLQGLPHQYRHSPLGQDAGGIMQESIALLHEMIIGRSRHYAKYLAKTANEVLGTNYTWVEIYAAKNAISTNHDRKTADEVTYNQHIAMRIDLERDLISGKSKVKDLPYLWREQSLKFLGRAPKTHKEGVLQDVHWFIGKVGLFPAYTLGHAIAAQMAERMLQQNPSFNDEISFGDFRYMQKWLNANIYSQGRIYDVPELVRLSTGRKFDETAQLAHLERRLVSHRQRAFKHPTYNI